MKKVATLFAPILAAVKGAYTGSVRFPTEVNDPEAWPLVVMFHNAYPLIRRGDVFHMWNATTAQIKSIIEYISQRYEFIDEAYLLANLGSAHKFKGKVLLTFDDGYASIYTELRDYLHERKIRPLLFLVEQAVRSNQPLWYQRLAMAFRRSRNRLIRHKDNDYDLTEPKSRKALYHALQAQLMSSLDSQSFEQTLKEALMLLGWPEEQSKIDSDLSFMSRDQIQDLVRLGWSVGAHGVTHTPFHLLSPTELQYELEHAKAGLKELLGVTVHSLSYPNGFTTEAVINQAKEYYQLGFLAGHPNSALSALMIPRYDFPYEDSGIRSKHIPQLKAFQDFLLSNAPESDEPSKLTVNTIAKSRTSAVKKRIVMLCGANHPERYAVSRISARHDLVGLFVHNFASKRLPVVAGLVDDIEFDRLEHHLSYENLNAKVIFGSRSLAFGISAGCQCLQTTQIDHPLIIENILSLKPDVLLVFGTGLIRDRAILALPIPKLNLHWGKSPFYRGSNTLRWPILKGDLQGLAVTVHELTYGIDSGPIFAQSAIVLDGSETAIDIEYRASVLGVEIFLNILDQIQQNVLPETKEQNLSDGNFYRVNDWCSDYDKKVEEVLEDLIAT
jgi:peptidoglycan/xylan/chitin deacetylase (PgdA/CDA1 family)/folate-dependent phosphoribosylglycinamide formyltransferase PurN